MSGTIDADVITELTAAIESARLMDARAVLAGFTEPVADALTSRGEASPTQR